tara:strand:- start:13987 stop:14853 length:867 start_codon:yes stop_codon:yes gene_type:complete
MTKIFSYCLFEPKELPSFRTWDKNKDEQSRYFYNILATILANRILYPDYVSRIYITPNIKDNKLYEVLEILSPEFVDIVLFDFEYKLTEPSISRMIPLWQDNVEVLHPRDLDSIPTDFEYKFVRAFEQSSCSSGTLRTHPSHRLYCTMLAGLSSFKPKTIPHGIKGDSFKEYFSRSNGKYGCDQDLMIKTFTMDGSYTALNFFDCKGYLQHHNPIFPCILCESDDLNRVSISKEKAEVFTKINNLGFNNWAGEPVDCRGSLTRFILSKFPSVKNQIEKNISLKSFYLT